MDVEYFNINADEEKRLATVQAIKEQAGDKPCRMVLRSLAFGSLKAYAADTPDEEINQKQSGNDSGRHGKQSGLLGTGFTQSGTHWQGSESMA